MGASHPDVTHIYHQICVDQNVCQDVRKKLHVSSLHICVHRDQKRYHDEMMMIQHDVMNPHDEIHDVKMVQHDGMKTHDVMMFQHDAMRTHDVMRAHDVMMVQYGAMKAHDVMKT